jgi:hypothetical protein
MAAAVADAATADLRSRLADADNAIGQVVRLAESWEMQGGVIDVEQGWSYSLSTGASVTGAKFSASNGGVIMGTGGNVNFFPGSSAGTTGSGTSFGFYG